MSILLALALAAEVAGPNVTLPLEEYEKLRQLRERPSITVVDLLGIEGSFGRRDLAVTIQGRASGTQPTTEVLGGEGFRLFACTGEALVTRAESGRFALTPLAPRFEARCRVALDGSDRLEATALSAVLDVASSVSDGELVTSEDGGGERSFSVVRRLAGGDAVLPPSVAGRYKVTLLPEETRFLYRLEVRNPNRSRHRFELALREAEHVESVNAPVAWDKDGRGYRFELPPGESVIELAGRLAGDSFAPPVEASLQYLLLESHPLIRAEVAGAAKRVGVGEVGLPAGYRGAQAFLLDAGDTLTWKTARLEALKTAGLAISRLEQVWFMGASGEVRGEARLSIDNQGAPALELPVAGETTFAAVDGEPTFLTLNAAGRLFLPLGQGAQTVVVQTKRPFRSALGFAAASLELPQVGPPASQASVELRYPAEWRPIYEELSPESRFRPMSGAGLARLALLLLMVERLLLRLGLARRRRYVLSGAVVVAGAFSQVVLGLAAFVAILAFLAGAVAWLWRRLTGGRLAAALAASVLAGVMLLVVALSPSREEDAHAYADGDSYGYGVANVDKAMRSSKFALESPSPAPPPAMQAPSQGVVGDALGGYQGLPAQIELPPGSRRGGFSRQLLATDAPRRVYVLLASSRLVGLLTWLTALLALGLAIRARAELAQGVRDQIARLRAPLPSAPPPSPRD